MDRESESLRLAAKAADRDKAFREHRPSVEAWTAPPYAGRAIKDQVEFSDNGTTSFEYDPATNTIYERPESSPRPAPNDDPVA